MWVISFTPGCNKDIYCVQIIANFPTLDEAKSNLCELVDLDINKLQNYECKNNEYDSDDDNTTEDSNNEYTYKFDFINDYDNLLGIEMIHGGNCVYGLKFRLTSVDNIKGIIDLKKRLVGNII